MSRLLLVGLVAIMFGPPVNWGIIALVDWYVADTELKVAGQPFPEE
jgi:hypothetical protein